MKIPVTPPGIDPGTVRLVAQRLNHYGNPGPNLDCNIILESYYPKCDEILKLCSTECNIILKSYYPRCDEILKQSSIECNIILKSYYPRCDEIPKLCSIECNKS
jgi:hypothetical protein